MKKADIGLIGLAVMGENLALNMKAKVLPLLYITVVSPVRKGWWTVL